MPIFPSPLGEGLGVRAKTIEMSEHESKFLQELEKRLKKQYIKYLITAFVFLIIGWVGFYTSVKLTFANHETRIEQGEKNIADIKSDYKNLETRLFNHCAKQ